MTTDYTPGSLPVPVGAVVEYFGSHAQGRYEITSHQHLQAHPHKEEGESWSTAYPDGVAYDIWPVGVPRRFGNRDRAVYWVRRTSFRVILQESPGEKE